MKIGSFKLPYYNAQWRPQPDWIDISNVANNEIHLLAADVGIRAVSFSVTAGGSYNVDWGDGTQSLNIGNGLTVKHTYTLGAGQNCSLGYTTFKIRIWAATTITAFNIKQNTDYNYSNSAPILWAAFGTTGLTTMASMFNGSSVVCYLLEAVYLPNTLNSVTSLASAFNSCYGLQYINYPSAMNSVTTMSSAHSNNSALKRIKLPESMSSCTVFSTAFNANYTLEELRLPTVVGNVTALDSLCNNCYSLRRLYLPSTLNYCTTIANMCNANYSLEYIQMPTSMTAVTTVTSAFSGTYSLKSVTLPDMPLVNTFTNFINNSFALRELNNFANFGVDTASTGILAMTGCEELREFSTRLAGRILINGNSVQRLKLESFRYYSPNVTSSSTSPAINVSYTNLSAAALNQLFTDLPNAAKTITITGATGAATCDTTIITNKGWTVIN